MLMKDYQLSVIVAVPYRYVTVTSPYTGTALITGPTTVTTLPPSGTMPGVIMVETPESVSSSRLEEYVTTTRLYTGSLMITGPLALSLQPFCPGAYPLHYADKLLLWS